MTKRRNLVLVVALGVVITIFASAFVAIRFAVRDYSPGALALLRFLVASAVLGLAARRRLEPIARRHLPGFLVLGMTGIFLYHWAVNTGEQTVSAGAASLLVGTVPVWTALGAQLFLGETLGRRAWIGIAVAFAGAFLVSIEGVNDLRRLPLGALLLLLAAIVQTVYFLVQRSLVVRYSPLSVTAISIWLGTLPLLLFTPSLIVDIQRASAGATLAAVYLGIAPSAIAYSLWAYALSRLPAARGTTLLFLVPPVALVLGWLFLGERPALTALCGGAVTLIGVGLVLGRCRGAVSLGQDLPQENAVPRRSEAEKRYLPVSTRAL